MHTSLMRQRRRTRVTPVQPVYLPAPYQDFAEHGRLILRDGTTATIRLAQQEDRGELREFFKSLSLESRRRRFFSLTLPSEHLLDTLCDSSQPTQALTLIVTRLHNGMPYVLATGSYLAVKEGTAEVAFAVEDACQGKGLGTLLLERLAVLAARHGFVRFWAVTHADNQPMLQVFRDSGFQLQEEQAAGYTEITFPVHPNEPSIARSEMRDRVATAASLRPFFRPQSVAVIGASRDPASIGRRVLDALVENHFAGLIFPVNPRANDLAGLRTYPSIKDVPQAVDLAILTVPRDAVLPVVDDCAQGGVRALVVITAGFAEVNDEGRELQTQLVEKVRGYGMRMVGPNCMGLLNADPAVRLNASFSPVFPLPGRVAMSSQSGALGLAILANTRRLQLGMSTFVSVGNKADISSNDLLQYWEEDAGTDVILLYLESFGNPRRFARIARRVSRRKPIVVMKAGRTGAGKRAAGSHTAALAASDVAVDALFHQAGVIRAETLEEMFELAAALSSQPLPRSGRVAIVTNAGGPGILCADACEAGGLRVPELSKVTRTRLAAILPPAAGLSNPVDMIASATPEHYRRVVQNVLTCGEVDALLVIYIPVGVVETAAFTDAVLQGVAQARTAGGEGKPVYACVMREDGVQAQLVGEKEKIPSYVFPESAARALSKAAAYAGWRARPLGMIPDFSDMDFAEARAICQRALQARGGGWLTVTETRQLLDLLHLPTSRGAVVETADEAAAIARGIGFPVAVKLASHQIVHKTEMGGVRLHVQDEAAVRKAYEEIRQRLANTNQLDAMEGVLVQPMLTGGVEGMMGVTQDAQFGPLIAFGLGGIHVEILGDVCFRLTPLTDLDAQEMVQGIRGYRLLTGYRGTPPTDIEALQEALLRVSRLVEEIPEISELDLNPVFALPPGEGCRIVDARIRIGQSRP
jgi:acetyl coenzyme A synthetase (ADP forming)-like protein